MPYISFEKRPKYDALVEGLLNEFSKDDFHPGCINYFIFSFMKKWFELNRNYFTANTIEGVLSCVSKELYRRLFSEYEDECIKKNGDV